MSRACARRSARWCTAKFTKLLMHKQKSGIMAGGHYYTDEVRAAKSKGLMEFWPGSFRMNQKTGRIKASNCWRRFTQVPTPIGSKLGLLEELEEFR